MSNLPNQKTPNDFTFKHSGQADAFGNSKGGNVATIQEDFDKRAIYNQDQINEILTSLTSNDGAKQIIMSVVSGIIADGGTVQQAIENLKAALDSATTGTLPDRSINYIKIALDTLTESEMAADMKKQSGGVFPFDSGNLNTVNISNNTTSISEIATNKDVATDGQVLTSNGDGTSTFETLVVTEPGWEKIIDFNAIGGESQIDFDSLDLDTYKYIKIICSARALVNAGGVNVDMRFNDIATTSYRIEDYAFTNSYSRNQTTSATYYRITGLLASSGFIIDLAEILISNQDKEKNISHSSVVHGTQVSQPSTKYMGVGYLDNTALITKISLICAAGTTFSSDSNFVLMGVKA